LKIVRSEKAGAAVAVDKHDAMISYGVRARLLKMMKAAPSSPPIRFRAAYGKKAVSGKADTLLWTWSIWMRDKHGNGR
jgi:hypothetical protein